MSIVAGHPLLQVRFLLGWWWLLACMGFGFDDPELTHVYFRLEAKCSALSYKTPLGTGRNGYERARLLAMKKHTMLVFLLHIVYAMCVERLARGGSFSFFLVQIALDR